MLFCRNYFLKGQLILNAGTTYFKGKFVKKWYF